MGTPKSSFIFFVVLGLAFFAGCQRQSARSIVARVNQQDIFLFDLHTRLKEYQFDPKLNTPEKNTHLKKEVLNELIQEQIMFQHAQRLKVKPSQEEVEKNTLMMYGGKVSEMSTWQSNALKQRISRQLQARKLFEHITKDILPPNEAALKLHYESQKEEAFIQEDQIRFQQVIVSQKTQAQKILKELKEGATFSQMIKAYSVEPESSLAGDTGWVARGMFDAELESMIYPLSPGALSPVIKSSKGFHIVKIIGKKPSKTLTFEEVRDFIFENMLQEKREKHYKQWLEERILESNIERNHALLQEDIPIN